MARARVLLVEDEEILRTSLALFLQRGGYDVEEAVDEKTALERLDGRDLNLVITDLFLSDGNGFGIMKHIQERCPDVKCIVITGHASLDSAIKALRKGAFDYLLKPFEYDELKDAVERAVAKQSDERVVKKVDYQEIGRRFELTRKELLVTKLVISEGLSNDEMAEKLKISKNTVKVHLRNIFKKMGVESKTALTTMLLSGNSR
ncbi:MAG: response regulator transcription factor [Nitrospirae bacterium]|nr:response regulator transcription factor [Nitrospirota bacterium]